MNDSIESIYFDLGNVLLFFDHEIAVEQIAAMAGRPREDVRRAVFHSGIQSEYEKGRVEDEEFAQFIRQALKCDCPTSELTRAASDIFTPNADIMPLVEELAGAGYRIGILSNTCHAHWEFVKESSYPLIPRAFDPLVLSFEVGALKPEAAIYEAAISAMGISPSRIFFTDDLQQNIDAARHAGLTATRFQGVDQLRRALITAGVSVATP